MALDPVPTWIHGAKHSGDVLRMGTFNETGGAEGVSSPTAFRVRATPTPSNMVRVDPGGLLLLSPWDEGQTYSMRNASETLVEVPASSSLSANTWYINAWVNDPNKPGGTVPVSKEFGPYNFLTCDPEPKGNNPAYACAEINVPKSEATILQDYITDLREVAQPKSKEVSVPRPTIGGDNGLELRSGKAFPEGEWFPNVGGNDNTGRYSIFVPKWATRMQIRCEWLSINYKNDPGKGLYWVSYGPNGSTTTPDYYTQAFGWNGEGVMSGTTNWILEQQVGVQRAWRGTVQNFYPRATRYESGGYVGLTSSGGMVFRVRFLEEAEL